MALLTVDGVIELGFITSMVHWLHVRAGKWFMIEYQGDTFSLNGKPKNFLLNQGHASNGAGGTAFIVVGLGGCLALFLRNRQLKRRGSTHGFTSFFYNFWLVMTVLSAIYSFAAFIYVFTLTYQHDHQSINLKIASQLHNRPYPHNVPYPDMEWTPQNWFPAILRLNLVDPADRSDIQMHLNIMKGWQWNLIPMFILGIVVCALAFVERSKRRTSGYKNNDVHLEAARQKNGSPFS